MGRNKNIGAASITSAPGDPGEGARRDYTLNRFDKLLSAALDD
jgi:hypothetical protein